MIWLGVVFIVWLEVTEPPTDICTNTVNFSALPEMCDAKFNRKHRIMVKNNVLYSSPD